MNEPVSFVLRATDYRFFDPLHPYFENAIARTAHAILRGVVASCYIPVVGVAGAVWHTGRAFTYICNRQQAAKHLKKAVQDISYAGRFAALGVIQGVYLTIFVWGAIMLPTKPFLGLLYLAGGAVFFYVFSTDANYRLGLIQMDRIAELTAQQNPEISDHLLDFISRTLYATFNNDWGRSGASTSSGTTWHLSIDRKDLKDNPEGIISSIAAGAYARNPNATGLRIRYKGELGIDLNGLSRDFISGLFGSLATRASTKQSPTFLFEKTDSGLLPTAAESPYAKFRYLEDAAIAGLTRNEITELLFLAYKKVPDQYTGSRGIDDALVKSSYETIRSQLPALSPDEQKGYAVLGKFLGMSEQSKQYPTGILFSESLFDMLCALHYHEAKMDLKDISTKTHLRMFELKVSESPIYSKMFRLLSTTPSKLKASKEWKEDLLYLIYPTGDFPEHFATDSKVDFNKLEENFDIFQDCVHEQLVRFAKNDKSVAAVHAIASGMVKNYSESNWKAMRRQGGAQLSATIQGVLSKDIVLRRLRCSDSVIRGYFQRWCAEVNSEELGRFVKAATGATAFGASQEISVEVTADTARHPAFHTCTGQIDVPRYANYKAFKEKLNEAITNGLAGFTAI